MATPSSVMEQLKNEFQLDDFSYNLVYEYLKLDQSQRKTVREFLLNVVAADHQHEETEAERIDREVSEYRRELELEARQEERSEVS